MHDTWLLPSLPSQIVHPPCGYTFHAVRHSLAATRGSTAREVAPFSELRDVQIHRPYTGILFPSRRGLRPLARQVPKRDAKVILLSVPCPERVPPLILRLVTRCPLGGVVV